MMAFVATLVLKEGKEQDFEDLQRKLAKLSIDSEPDLITYHVIRQREAERTYVVYAAFKDDKAFEYHMQTDFHDDLVPPILDCLAEEMDLKMFDGI
ncbi:MAG: antibiotic biosynthesis monooxygenase family protein [Pseudomonadota bacterium]